MIPDAKRPPLLETERLRLSPVLLEDAAGLFPMMRDPEVMAYWDWPEIEEPERAFAIVEGRAKAAAEGQAVHWTMRTLADDQIIGACDLSAIDRRHRRAEVGFLLSRESWGRGFGLEAMRAVVAYAAASGLRKLTARTQLGDRRSAQLLARLGFEREGLLRGHVERDGERRDCHLFGLLL
jgi:ribosomal-protein-alanine N-acetyltransferase